ncbi:hypothetical protein K445DRAFT_23264 [Daldinia sp. EC12]|nr:hypothetical protein K445DRAFT_23264 [Daldinia sp. EC12]
MLLNKVAAAVALLVYSSAVPISALCRHPPPTLDSTSSIGDTSYLTWTILSDKKGSNLNNKQVKLRPLAGLPAGGLVVIDDLSPVLMTRFWNNSLYAVGRDKNNKVYELGPTGYLNMSSISPHRFAKFDFLFANVTGLPGPNALPMSVDTKWVLQREVNADVGTYKLIHDAIAEIIGFSACPEGPEGKDRWYRLIYMASYSGEQWDNPGCENVAVRTIVKAGGRDDDNEGCIVSR